MDGIDAASRYRRRHGRNPDVVVSAPGRVNLIGEHTDYSLLPVLPFAIDRRIHLAMGQHDGLDVHSDRANKATLGYVQAAINAIGISEDVAIEIVSDLPETGGLSSSSALTLGLIAGLANLGSRRLSVAETVDLAIGAERRVGVESGGMDQTVIAHARAGHVLRIDFRPPSMTDIPIPEGLSMVAAYSGRTAQKATGARQAYNDRVMGCRVAAVLLGANPTPAAVLADVAGATAAELAQLPERATVASVGDPEILRHLTTGKFDQNREVPVRESARHVLSEARRVRECQQALIESELEVVGRLIDESQASLVRFGASTLELDSVIAAMRGAGALGARLTGAGFGGYALALCRPDQVGAVCQAARGDTRSEAFAIRPTDGLRVEDQLTS